MLLINKQYDKSETNYLKICLIFPKIEIKKDIIDWEEYKIFNIEFSNQFEIKKSVTYKSFTFSILGFGFIISRQNGY